MAEVTIRAEQRVAGLVPGAVVTVERTDKIEKLIAHGRVTVVEIVTGPDASTFEISGGPDGGEGVELATSEVPQIITGPAEAVKSVEAVEISADPAAKATGRRKKPTGDAS